jgi:hypothetical protein
MNSLYRVVAKTKFFKLNSSFSCLFDKKFFSSNYSSHNDKNNFSKIHNGRRTPSEIPSSRNNFPNSPKESESNEDMTSSSHNPNSRRSQVTWLNRYNKMRKYNSHEDLELFRLHNERKLLKQEGKILFI